MANYTNYKVKKDNVLIAKNMILQSMEENYELSRLKKEFNLADFSNYKFIEVSLTMNYSYLDIYCEIYLVDKSEIKAFQLTTSGVNVYNYGGRYPVAKRDWYHVYAVFLWLSNYNFTTMPFRYLNPNRDEIIKEYERHQEVGKGLEILDLFSTTDIENNVLTDLKLVPYMETTDKIRYKIGNEKLYQVKSLKSLLDNMSSNNPVSLGKSINGVINSDSFDEFSNKQLSTLAPFIYNLSAYSNKVDCIEVDDRNIEALYSLYKNITNLNFHFYKADLNQFRIAFKKEADNYYRPEIEHDFDAVYFGKHIIFARKGFDYYLIEKNLSTSKVEALRRLYDARSYDRVLVSEDRLEDFKNFFNTALRYISIVDEDNNKLIKRTYRIYGDINDQQLFEFSIVVFADDKEEGRGFSENNTDLKLQQIENIFEDYQMAVDKEKNVCLIDPQQKKTINFVNEAIPELSRYGEVFVSDAIKNLTKKTNYNVSVGIRFVNDLLEVDVSSSSIPKEELADVLKQYKRKKKFYKLKNGETISLSSDSLEEVSHLMDSLDVDVKQLVDGKAQLDSYRAFSADVLFNNSDLIDFYRDDTFKERLNKFKTYDDMVYEIPEKYVQYFRDYQINGFDWLCFLHDSNFNGILADDMGLGKTLQVLALLENYKNEGCSLVVCPASLIYNWQQEIEKFGCDLKYSCVVGNKKERDKIIDNYQDYELLITSYDYCKRDIEQYKGKKFNYCILDEAQYIKNQTSQNAKSAKVIDSNHRLALTGTPIENTLAELWSIFDFLMPGYLYSYTYFKNEYEKDIVANQDEDKSETLKKLVSPFILRRLKKNVLTELPDKEEKTITVNFSEDEKKLYYAMLSQVNEELAQITNVETSKIEILTMLTRLRQICCDPRLIYSNIDTISSKLEMSMSLIREIHEKGQKVLVFSSFTSMLDLIAQQLDAEKIKYLTITGSVSKEDRIQRVSQFQNDDTTVFLISLKAGGTGLNLTAATNVIHYDPWWNIAAQNQATDRTYRIGQNENVTVYKLVMKDSVEDKILQLQQRKQFLSDTFVDTAQGSLTSLSKEELRDLFSI